MGWLDGEVAIITGGGSGLGLALVERFVAEGARVSVFDKSKPRLEEVQDTFGDKVITTQGDVRSLLDNFQLVNKTVEHFGKLDCFLGNAGIWDFNRSLFDTSSEEIDGAFDEMFAVNVKGYLYGAKAALEPLVQSKGALVYTVSNAGFYPGGGGPLYTMTKHAIVGLVRQLAFEFGPHVRVNGMAPGPIATDIRGAGAMGMEEKSITEVTDRMGKFAESQLPRMHMPETKEYTGAYVLLASRENSNMATGTIIQNDGGFGLLTAGRPVSGVDLAEKIAAKRGETD